MKNTIAIVMIGLFFSCSKNNNEAPGSFKHVDQVLWVVEDLDKVISQWNLLGFNQIIHLGTANVFMKKGGNMVKIKIAKANLGGASVTWIQPVEGESLFSEHLKKHGEGAISLVHRMEKKKEVMAERRRLARLGVDMKEEIRIPTRKGEIWFMLADTYEKGKYYLGYTTGWDDEQVNKSLSAGNLHNLTLNQYAFAVREPEPVSAFWHSLGQPAFEMSDPILGNPHYYGQPSAHSLRQGWQRGYDIAYEWCIPVKNPTVYNDFIVNHGDGIHHLAYQVKDMDVVLNDFKTKGFTVSQGGTWGETGKPGSGRYEYIDMEGAGSIAVELLWNFK
ncbi:MAG TPA: VOC family protein [Prolixibacteraceae bacterium]|nr:VOC family protein [Prolixibacteraceae bacterium]